MFGGNVTACRALLASSFPQRADLVLVDSTQISNPPPGLLIRTLLAAKRVLTFIAKVERSRPDVVLLFASVGASLVEKGTMAWYARLRGIPALLCPRGGAVMDASRRSRFTRAWVRLAFRGARKIICQGPAWQRFAIDMMAIAPEDAPIVTNWTATPALLAVGERRRADESRGEVRLIFVGWLEQKKGVFELLEACAELAPARRFTLDIVGEGHASAAAREKVKASGLEGVVRFRGWLSPSQVEEALAEGDVFVLPSWAEGLPNAMIEAMAARLAVVVSSVGNIPDLVTDGREALLVPPHDVVALREALARVIDDPRLRKQLGDAAFDLAVRRWSVEPAVDGILAATEAALERSASP